MTSYPITADQFTANCAALNSLVNGRRHGTDTQAVYCKRLTAANSAIARMRTFYNRNPDSNAAPHILARVQSMQKELDLALTRNS